MTSGREVASTRASEGSDLLNQAASILAREMARLGADVSAPDALAALPAANARDGSPLSGLERLRRQAHEILETFLTVLSPKPDSPGERVPLLRCAAPVEPGGDGSAAVRVANDELTPSEVTLYCTSLIGDSGYDIPPMRVTISPRTVTVPPKGEATFEVKIAVPQQTPPGMYSGLFQATGTKYVKAVLSVEVK
jgi:hypothetical protein